MHRPRIFTPSLPWLGLLGAILCLFGSHVGRSWDFTVDDAGITFSYARNIANGFGMVLTPGAERVEAATNFLWVLLLVPAEPLGMTHELLAKILGMSLAAGALAAIAMFPAVAYRRRPAYYDLVAPLVAATFAHSALWCTSGLENGLVQFLVALSLVLVAHEENNPEALPWSAVTLSALFATRPDGGLYLGAIGLVRAARASLKGLRRQDVRWALGLVLGVGGLEVFRLAYFAWPVPNSFYIKRSTYFYGKDLIDLRSEGWSYVGAWLEAYKLKHALALAPLALLGVRAMTARVALLACVAAGMFLPVYSHGDWMEEFRFLTFVAPLVALSIAEGVRGVTRLPLALAPRSLQTLLALGLTPLAAYVVLSQSARAWPGRFQVTRTHNTLEFSLVRQRGRYLNLASRMFGIENGTDLDPDVGGTAYDSGLQIVDLYGLGEVAVAHTHGANPSGEREFIFRERRPTYIHLHGAWFGYSGLDRSEELEHLYLRLPIVIGTEHEDASNWVSREALAAPWTETAERGPPLSTHGPCWLDGYTLSATALDPGERLLTELTFSGSHAGQPGVLVAQRQPSGPQVEAALRPGAEIIPPSAFLAGERARVRAPLTLSAGTWELRWRGEGAEAVLATVTVAPGAGSREVASLRRGQEARVREGDLRGARTVALGLRLRVLERTDPDAAEALAVYPRALAQHAWALGASGAYAVAAEAALEAQRFTRRDSRTLTVVQSLAERLADEARASERRGELPRAFGLARDAVLIDPQRSWMRRAAERLRRHRPGVYDGGRAVAAYHTAAAALAGNAELDTALEWLGATERWSEAATLADRNPTAPSRARARLAAARGFLARGETARAQALASAVPCDQARDLELARALRVDLGGRAYRPGDALCERPWPSPAPWTPATAGFEAAVWRGWTATGTAFGAGPVHDHPSGETAPYGWNGWSYASSFAHNATVHTAGDLPLGLLRSTPFTVRAPALSFLVAGGMDAATVGVRLVIDGAPVLRAAGQNSEVFRRVWWDLRPYVGRTATLELYDEAAGNWGHILADDFREEPSVPVE